jgi:hypothetical protein
VDTFWRREQVIARAAAAAAQEARKRHWRGDDGDDDGPGGVREPRRPIGPKPGASFTTVDE